MSSPETFYSMFGFDIVEWHDGFVRVALDVQPKHLNGAGILHGGTLMTMMDEAGSLCGLWCSVKGNRRWSVTVDMDCRFVGQARSGRVTCTGAVVSQGRSLYFTRTEVTDAEGRVLSYGASSHKWRRGSETVEGVLKS